MLDLSGKIINRGIAEVCRAISAVANAQTIPFYMVGATARDILCQGVYDIKPVRATLDIDFGVKVSSLSEFSSLKQALVATGNFQETRAAQRLLYSNGLPVDIVPFGDIASDGMAIVWPPPNDDTELNILGFEEAFEHAFLVRLSSTLELWGHWNYGVMELWNYGCRVKLNQIGIIADYVLVSATLLVAASGFNLTLPHSSCPKTLVGRYWGA